VKFCARCGRTYDPVDLFCEICGIELDVMPAGRAPRSNSVVPPLTKQAIPEVPNEPVTAPSVPIASAPRPLATWNAAAIVALVTMVVGFTIVAIPAGHIALHQIKRTGARGRGMAIFALMIAYPVFIFWTVIVIVSLTRVSY